MEVQPLPDRQSLPTRGIKGSPAVWMEEKKIRDTQLWDSQTSELWIVENKLYDLKEFASKHPGGEKWINLTKGQDITDLFVTHHLNEDKARDCLQKYYVKDTKNKVSRFSFEPDGLYRTVKSRLLKEMSVEDIQDESKSKRHALVVALFFLTSLLLTLYSIDPITPSKWTYLFTTLTACSFIGMLGIGHNFVHHKDNLYKYFYMFTGFTHHEWQIMHCISHHIYPNTQLDYQAAAIEPIAYFIRSLPKNKIYTEIILNVMFIFVQPLNMILKLAVVPILKKKMPDFWYAVPLILPALFFIVSQDFWYSFKLHCCIYGTFGILFLRIVFCGHRLQQLWTEGAQRYQDFGEHTILSTSDTDIGVTGLLSYLLLAGLNIHTPHHFFPTADHAVLPKILIIVDEVCKERGIKHSVQNRMSCFKSLSRGITHRIPFTAK